MKKILSLKIHILLFFLISIVACSVEDGTNGMDGIDGVDGVDGSNGLNSLIKTAIEQPGTNCPNGGYQLNFGLDSNNNGVLDNNEISSTEYLCNTDPADGLTSLISTIIEQPGDNCVNGGYRLEVGLDSNANGLLDASEISTSEYLCNGDADDFNYQSYTSILRQVGTEDPVEEVLENSLGLTVNWARQAQGIYIGTLDVPIDISKTVIFFSTPISHTAVRGELINSTQIRLELQNGINAFADNFDNLSFELRVYE